MNIILILIFILGSFFSLITNTTFTLYKLIVVEVFCGKTILINFIYL